MERNRKLERVIGRNEAGIEYDSLPGLGRKIVVLSLQHLGVYLNVRQATKRSCKRTNIALESFWMTRGAKPSGPGALSGRKQEKASCILSPVRKLNLLSSTSMRREVEEDDEMPGSSPREMRWSQESGVT